MRTSKPIATISYNSQGFLEYQLNELVKAHKISDYMYIFHHGEEDTKKDHIHLWIKPNTLIDTMDLQNHFKEFVQENPTKPLKCIDFVSSKVDDWILYSQHYEPYLKMKGEVKEYHYLKSDFHYYDEDTFEELYNHALKGSEFAKKYQVLRAISENKANPIELILNGTVGLNMATNLKAVDSMMRNRYHDDIVKEIQAETGFVPVDNPDHDNF